MADKRQTIKFCAFGSKPLGDLLKLKAPPFAKKPFRQLQYIQEYVNSLKCVTVIIEEHYIDRDHIEDHGAFYARNFVSYENYCRRLHFFSLDKANLKRELKVLIETGKKDKSEYRKACKEFSQTAYLGFSVIKPLDGCPVGRTILRTYDRRGDNCVREFPCVRPHPVHILGVELTVEGLPFQQQDTGVSACATTAIWSALSHLRGVEDFAAATPAQITSIASRFSLPFGRPMPSEGLSIEQMCQAIQGVGVSPHLYRAADFQTAQSIMYSATMSGMSSILIIERGEKENLERHAVALAGIELAESFTPTQGVVERSTQLLGAYIHDDRWGPYVSTVFKDAGGRGQLQFLHRGVIKEEEPWFVTRILIPTHAKIRLSFSGLQQVAMQIAIRIRWYFINHLKLAKPNITYSTSILRGYKYVQDHLLFDKSGFEPDKVKQFSSEVSLPRYVGLIRVENPLIGVIDVLVDTTGTLRNLYCSAVLCRVPTAQHAATVGDFLAKHFAAIPRAFGL